MPGCIVEPESRSPIVNDKNDILELERVNKRFGVTGMRLKCVVDVGFVRFTETDVVDGDDPPFLERHIA